MDSMELEREKGITIKSAATYTTWGSSHINIIDTPGHVDFTIEVERSLRVLDGAILVVCAVGCVQSQTITVDRQMRRYNVPRIVFINKLDRLGADPWKAQAEVRSKLPGDDTKRACAVQMPIGVESMLEGIIGLVDMKAYFYLGSRGDTIEVEDIPAKLLEEAKMRREELILAVSEVDEELVRAVLNRGADFEPDPTSKDEMPKYGITPSELKAAIRRALISRQFCPIFMGSAFKNKGVQQLLDGVIDYLPNPTEVENKAIDNKNQAESIILAPDVTKPFVGLAFKLEEGKFGQLTYIRTYQGKLQKGAQVYNTLTGDRVRIPRLVRMHSDEMEDIEELGPGEIGAVFGVTCSSGTTFTAGVDTNISLTSIHVPEAVLSLSVKIPDRKNEQQLSKALSKFQREDPTFRVAFDAENSETIISGMGELHLDIYVERMKREFGIQVETGKPRVSFREWCRAKTNFEYTHRKQSGGRGQYAKIMGFIEPLDETDDGAVPTTVEFQDQTVGNNIPPEFIPAIEKGFNDAVNEGPLTGFPIMGIRFVINDGAAHAVDSSEMAFRIAAAAALREAIRKAQPVIVEPIMEVTIDGPLEFQGSVSTTINRRKGIIRNTESSRDQFCITADAPLNSMFGYSTELRSSSQGKAEFSMVYKMHRPVTKELQDQLAQEYQTRRKQEQGK